MSALRKYNCATTAMGNLCLVYGGLCAVLSVAVNVACGQSGFCRCPLKLAGQNNFEKVWHK
jgi:hypothetical protein